MISTHLLIRLMHQFLDGRPYGVHLKNLTGDERIISRYLFHLNYACDNKKQIIHFFSYRVYSIQKVLKNIF